MAAELVVNELRSIAAAHDGLLRPEDVVEAARDVLSPLHTRFTWEDNEAARKYRLYEARDLIKTTVQYIEMDGQEVSFRVFCSLTPDRQEEGGGYRETVAILSNRKYREQLFADAIQEMKTFSAKYARLREFDNVLREMRKAVKKLEG